MVNSVAPLIILTILSTGGSGWDRSTQAITLRHHDRWNRRVLVVWAEVSPLVEKEGDPRLQKGMCIQRIGDIELIAANS